MKEVFRLFEQEYSSASRQSNTMHQQRDLRIEKVKRSKGMTESEAFHHLFSTLMRLSPETPEA
jgi:hypothetical protein